MNDRKLRSIMVLNGDKVDDLANFLNISRQSLTNKMNGKTEFTRAEMVMIKRRYKLNNDEFVKTFDVEG